MMKKLSYNVSLIALVVLAVASLPLQVFGFVLAFVQRSIQRGHEIYDSFIRS